MYASGVFLYYAGVEVSMIGIGPPLSPVCGTFAGATFTRRFVLPLSLVVQATSTFSPDKAKHFSQCSQEKCFLSLPSYFLFFSAITFWSTASAIRARALMTLLPFLTDSG